MRTAGGERGDQPWKARHTGVKKYHVRLTAVWRRAILRAGSLATGSRGRRLGGDDGDDGDEGAWGECGARGEGGAGRWRQLRCRW